MGQGRTPRKTDMTATLHRRLQRLERLARVNESRFVLARAEGRDTTPHKARAARLARRYHATAEALRSVND